MRIPRFIHKAFAWMFGYFWLRCPLCEEFFGGHEYNGGVLYKSYLEGMIVCPNCKWEAQVKSESFFFADESSGKANPTVPMVGDA